MRSKGRLGAYAIFCQKSICFILWWLKLGGWLPGFAFIKTPHSRISLLWSGFGVTDSCLTKQAFLSGSLGHS